MSVIIERSPADARGYRLTARMQVPRSRREVFAFFADAFRLESITPGWLHFCVLTPAPIEMRRGVLIDYRLRLFGCPFRWQSRISAWEPDERFVDEQVDGPYRYWHHEHRFESIEDPPGGGSAGHTLVCDVVDYAVPLGGLVHALFVKRQLRRIFEYRQRRLAELLAAADAGEPDAANSGEAERTKRDRAPC